MNFTQAYNTRGNSNLTGAQPCYRVKWLSFEAHCNTLKEIKLNKAPRY